MTELKVLDTEHASWVDEADAAGEIRCICTECGAINKVRSYYQNTPEYAEWVVECTVCLSEEVEDEPPPGMYNLALIIRDLRKELEDLRDELDPRAD